MKKNMISILILALLIVNVALTGIMMFSVMGTMKKTANLIDGITSALSLELTDPTALVADATSNTVSIDATEVYQIADAMTIALTKGADGQQHYCQVSISLSINKEHEDYAKYGATVGEKEDLIKSQILSVVSAHPIEEAEGNPDILRQEILEKIQGMYGSTFIFDVVFRDILFQ